MSQPKTSGHIENPSKPNMLKNNRNYHTNPSPLSLETVDCVIMITPNSPLTREWGITCRKHPMQLHALISWKEDYFKAATTNSHHRDHHGFSGNG